MDSISCLNVSKYSREVETFLWPVNSELNKIMSQKKVSIDIYTYIYLRKSDL